LDELSIIRFDDEVLSDIDKLLKYFKKFLSIDKQRKEYQVQMQSALL
jgi:hypothetical protein